MSLKYLMGMRRYLLRHKDKSFTMTDLRHKLGQGHYMVKENLHYLNRYENVVGFKVEGKRLVWFWK